MNKLIILTGLAFALTACTSPNKTNSDSVYTVNVDSLDNGIQVEPEIELPELNIDNFELDYFKSVAKLSEGKSFITSPISASFALAMVANISDSILQNRILDALDAENLSQLNNRVLKNINRLTSSRSDAQTLIGNSLWLTKRPAINLGSRKDSIQKYFNATVKKVDFTNQQTFEDIAQWGLKVSDGNISPNLTGINEDCASIIMNLIYYTGAWHETFRKGNTKKHSFHTADSDTLVDMMNQELYTSYYHTNDFTSVALGLHGDNSLILILPNKDVTPTEILASFDSSSLKQVVEGYQATNMILSLPRFETKTQLSLQRPLKEIGIELLPTQFKDIGIKQFNDLRIRMDQLTRINLDESGVETSAETTIVSGVLCAYDDEDEPKPVVVTFDRPFIYLLRNNPTKSIIVAGVYTGPEE